MISEYGASLWCEPEAWISEAARLLRPGGRLVFLTNSLLVALTAPPSGPNSDRLVRGQREISPLRFEDDDGVEFHLAHGDWIALLARHGFAVTGLHELYAPPRRRAAALRLDAGRVGAALAGRGDLDRAAAASGPEVQRLER